MSKTKKSFPLTVTGSLQVYDFDDRKHHEITGPCRVEIIPGDIEDVYRFLPDSPPEEQLFWSEHTVGIASAFWQRCCAPNLKNGVLDAVAVETTDKERQS